LRAPWPASTIVGAPSISAIVGAGGNTATIFAQAGWGQEH
jgi:hypothetical protein